MVSERARHTVGCDRLPTVRERILVIDDSESYLNFMCVLLSEEFQVTTVTTLPEAEQCLATSPPDLVITDVLLPGLEPFAVLDTLDKQSNTCKIPVLVCTGAVLQVEGASERLQRPHLKVLFKPFDIDALITCVKELTAGASN
jgi:DNA-binding NtrC family response regulator